MTRKIRLPLALVCIFIFFCGVAWGYELWGRTDQVQTAIHTIKIAEKFPERQFVVEVRMGDTAAQFLVDTGASTVLITVDLAEKLHLAAIDVHESVGIGGKIATWKVRIPEMRIGDIVVKNVEADVSRSPFNLLGMPFLEQMQRIELRGSILTFEQ